MSAVNAAESTSKSASKKKKKSSKKKANGKPEVGSTSTETNGVKGTEADEEGEDEEGTDSPVKANVPNHVVNEDSLHMPSSPPEPAALDDDEQPLQNGAEKDHSEDEMPESSHNEEMKDETISSAATTSSSDASSRLDAMQQERDNLRAEVTQLRQSLESLQERHNEELSNVKEELEQAQQGKENSETQYRNLVGKVNTIRSQLSERLKADTAELEETKGKLEELENVNQSTQEENERLQESIAELNSQLETQSSEIETLRNRTNLSTSNWVKERDDLVMREAQVREEYEMAKQAMQDWEILATEERARREALEERSQELEEQLANAQEAYERMKDESETQNSTVDGLQRALRDLQEERKRELRELVEQSQSQLSDLRAQTKEAEDTSASLQQQLTTTQAELERALPFEKEVREKNLLIGKLRHEAVTLNEHLTKALRFLKRGKPEDNVNRQLVTNHFLHFLELDRSDPKKFQILQLIAALLSWNEEEKEKAGLLRQGSLVMGSLKVPVSPFRRTPSTPALSTDFMAESPATATGKETLAELWSEFLEREAEAGSTASGGSGSRRGSVVKSVRSSSLTSPVGPTGGPGSTAPGGGRQSPEMKRKESMSGGASGSSKA